jgi:hypothetical protein
LRKTEARTNRTSNGEHGGWEVERVTLNPNFLWVGPGFAGIFPEMSDLLWENKDKCEQQWIGYGCDLIVIHPRNS